MAYCYIGRWLYLETCMLLPDAVPYLQSTIEALDPPTHDRIAAIIKSYSIPEALDRGIDNMKPHRDHTRSEKVPSNNSEEFPDDYF